MFADEALTGTKDTRPEFQKMMAECRAGRIDMVITVIDRMTVFSKRDISVTSGMGVKFTLIRAC